MDATVGYQLGTSTTAEGSTKIGGGQGEASLESDMLQHVWRSVLHVFGMALMQSRRQCLIKSSTHNNFST